MKKTIILITTLCLSAFAKDKEIKILSPIYENGKIAKYVCIVEEGNKSILEITDPDLVRIVSAPLEISGKETVESIDYNKTTVCVKAYHNGNSDVKLLSFNIKDLSATGTASLDGKLWGSSINIVATKDGFFAALSKKENKLSIPYYTMYDNKLNVLWEKFINYGITEANIVSMPLATSYDKSNETFIPMSYVNKPKDSPKDVHCGMAFIDPKSGKLLANHNYSAKAKHLLYDARLATLFSSTATGDFVAVGYSGFGEKQGINTLKIDAKTGNTVTDKIIALKSDEFTSKLPSDAKADVLSKTMLLDFMNIKRVGNSFFVIGKLHNRPFSYMASYSKKDLQEMSEYILVAELDADLKLKTINAYKCLPQFDEYKEVEVRYNQDAVDDKLFQVNYVNFKDTKNVEWIHLTFDGTKLVKTSQAVALKNFERRVNIYDGKNGKMNILTYRINTYSDGTRTSTIKLEQR